VAQQWEESTGKAVEAWGVNLTGFGLSTGPAYVHRLGAAALAAYDGVREKAGRAPIVVQATSLGTLAGMCVAANREVTGMLIQDPPPLRDLVLEYQGWWNGWLLSGPVALWLPGDIDSVANAQRCRGRCVFITSERDTVIPMRFQQRIVDAYAGEKRHVVIAGGKHCAQPDAVEAEEIARDRAWVVGGG
jgi:pimeloyl-ACP methyl ester carboxylesterase